MNFASTQSYKMAASTLHWMQNDLPQVEPVLDCLSSTKNLRRSGGRGFDFHRGQKIFSLPRVVPCFPLLGLTLSGLFMGLSSTLIYTSELILCSTICVPSATRLNIHMYPYFLFAAIHHLKSSPTFSVRPCSSLGRVTVDLIRKSWVRFPPRSKDFLFASCGSLFPLTRANAQWVRITVIFMGLSSTLGSTLIYTSELILCSTICVPSATRHNIHMYPYFLFAAIHHLKSSPTFSVRPCSSVGRVTVDLIRKSWVRFPPRSKDFFCASCDSLFPFTRANAQLVRITIIFMGLSSTLGSTLIYTSELILCSTICVPSAQYAAQHSYKNLRVCRIFWKIVDLIINDVQESSPGE